MNSSSECDRPDCQSTCWICLNLTPIDNTCSTAFQMLMRYLKIDLGNLWSGILTTKLNPEEKLNLCDRCYSRVNGFWHLYQDFETLRLYLDQCVLELCTVIKESDGSLQGRDGDGSFKKEIFRRLRIETQKKFALKNKTLPSVQLDKKVNNEAMHKCPPDLLSFEDNNEDHHNMLTSPSPSGSETALPVIPFLSLTAAKAKMTEVEEQRLPSCFTQQGLTAPSQPLRNKVIEFPTSAKMTKAKMTNFYKTRSPIQQRILCNYCEYNSRDRFNMITHQVQIHTKEFYANQIPSGTTNEELVVATLKVHQKHLAQPYNRKLSNVTRCGTCSNVFKQRAMLRVHILRDHFEEIVAALTDSALELPQSKIKGEVVSPPSRIRVVGMNVTDNNKSPPGPLISEVILPTGLTNSIKAKLTRKWKPTGPEKNRDSCTYCQYTSKFRFNMLTHKVLIHTLEFYADKIPSGTTNQEITAATLMIIWKHLAHPCNRIKSSVMRCASCRNVFKQRSALRVHILRDHFDEVVAALGKSVLPTYQIKNELVPLPTRDGGVYVRKKKSLPAPIHSEDISLNSVTNTKDKHDATGEGLVTRLFSCDYCEYSTKEKYNVLTHTIRLHTLEFYRNQLPSGTTNTEIVTATSIAIRRHVTHQENRNNSRITKCTSCNKVINHWNNFKIHILKDHFDEVVSALRSPNPNQDDLPLYQIQQGQQDWIVMEAEDKHSSESEAVEMEPFLTSNALDEDENSIYFPHQDPLSILPDEDKLPHPLTSSRTAPPFCSNFEQHVKTDPACLFQLDYYGVE